MIVRNLSEGRLLCIYQTSHALLAAAFCRYWGNAQFEHPEPFEAVMLAIAQHDNGWYEWETRPRLRGDGYPMDFLHDDDPVGKVALWERGVQRAAAQHPYAGLLVGNHATLLYGGLPVQNLPDEACRCVTAFVDEQTRRVAQARHLWREVPAMAGRLSDATIEANTRLLQFGDTASLQVCIPWNSPRRIAYCPVDSAGTYAEITMTVVDGEITFDPWPFHVDSFPVYVHGRLLAQRTFSSEADYHAALGTAPLCQMTWKVRP